MNDSTQFGSYIFMLLCLILMSCVDDEELILEEVIPEVVEVTPGVEEFSPEEQEGPPGTYVSFEFNDSVYVLPGCTIDVTYLNYDGKNTEGLTFNFKHEQETGRVKYNLGLYFLNASYYCWHLSHEVIGDPEHNFTFDFQEAGVAFYEHDKISGIECEVIMSNVTVIDSNTEEMSPGSDLIFHGVIN